MQKYYTQIFNNIFEPLLWLFIAIGLAINYAVLFVWPLLKYFLFIVVVVLLFANVARAYPDHDCIAPDGQDYIDRVEFDDAKQHFVYCTETYINTAVVTIQKNLNEHEEIKTNIINLRRLMMIFSIKYLIDDGENLE